MSRPAGPQPTASRDRDLAEFPWDRAGAPGLDGLLKTMRTAAGKRKFLLFLAVLSVATLLGCKAVSGANSREHDPVNVNTNEGIIPFKGKIVRLSFEGGFWGIETADGKKYEPITGFPPDYAVEGLGVRGKLRARKNLDTIHMWGVPADILQIERTNE